MLHTAYALDPVGYHTAGMETERHMALQLSPLHTKDTNTVNIINKLVSLHKIVSKNNLFYCKNCNS